MFQLILFMQFWINLFRADSYYIEVSQMYSVYESLFRLEQRNKNCYTEISRAIEDVFVQCTGYLSVLQFFKNYSFSVHTKTSKIVVM